MTTSPTELQALLDREGVPPEARAPLRIANTKAWWETECPGSCGTYIDDDLAELAHVGAMALYSGCSIQKCGGGTWIATEHGWVNELDYVSAEGRSWGGDTAAEALAHACGRIAKEKDNA